MDPYSWLAAFKLRTFDQIARAPPLCGILHKQKLVPGLADVGLGFPMGMGLAPELHSYVWTGQEKVSND